MVYPDVFVVEQEGEFVCDDHRRQAPMLHLNRYYQDLYRQTDDPEVKKYLAEKLVQAENVLFALRQRESTVRGGGAAGIPPGWTPCLAAHVHDGGGAGAGRASVYRQPCGER